MVHCPLAAAGIIMQQGVRTTCWLHTISSLAFATALALAPTTPADHQYDYSIPGCEAPMNERTSLS